MPQSSRSISHARRLMSGNRWPERIHGPLTVAIYMAFLAIVVGIWIAVLCCTGSDSATSEGCFDAALWACAVFTVAVLAKVFMNSRYPQP